MKFEFKTYVHSKDNVICSDHFREASSSKVHSPSYATPTVGHEIQNETSLKNAVPSLFSLRSNLCIVEGARRVAHAVVRKVSYQ